MDSTNNNQASPDMVQRFISNPETFTLFRGENENNKEGLHFTTDKEWAKNFGDKILAGNLPASSKIELLTEKDLKEDYELGITSERPFWDLIFDKGYDAIVGCDTMNRDELDVIVNPKHLNLFVALNTQ